MVHRSNGCAAEGVVPALMETRRCVSRLFDMRPHCRKERLLLYKIVERKHWTHSCVKVASMWAFRDRCCLRLSAAYPVPHPFFHLSSFKRMISARIFSAQSGQRPWVISGDPRSNKYFSIGSQLPFPALYFLQPLHIGSNDWRSWIAFS